MRIFIAGATGVVGQRLIPKLVEAGHEVTGLVRSQDKAAMLQQMGGRARSVSLFQPGPLREALKGQDVVINMATSIPSGPAAFLPWSWRENDRIRSEGVRNLVDSALDVGATRFIQESFAPIYEAAGDEWIDESYPVRPSSHTRTVLDAEASARNFSLEGGETVILRFAFFYGPDSDLTRQTVDSVRMGIAPSFGAGEDFVSALSHDDAASAVLTALHLPAGTYNVVDDEPLRRRAYVDALAAALDVSSPRIPPEWTASLVGPIGDIMARSQRMSNRKLKEAGNWSPLYSSVREGWRAVVSAIA